jgi:undecaprenyl-diphosphatase
MTLFQSILFGLVEGLTEFIPVSSTAHMLLVQRLLQIPATDSMFAYLVLVQLGAIAALLLYFWRDFVGLIRAFFAPPFSTHLNRMAWLIVLATLPALLAGALLRDVVRVLFADPLQEAAIRFFTAAVLLGLAEWLGRQNRDLESARWLDALIIGLFQVLSVFPGASRSGAAIAGGLFRDLDRASATRFAFWLSAPIMLAAGGYESLGAVRSGAMAALGLALPVGLLVAAVVGWLSIRWLLNYVARHRLYAFSAYCAVAGLLCLVLQRF